MSRIYFHSEQGEAEVYGTERAYMGKVIADIGLIPLMSMCVGDNPTIMKHIPEGCYLHDRTNYGLRGDFGGAFQTWFQVSDGGLLFDGAEHSCFGIGLNTALVAGSDPIKLYARIHGQCEMYGYVEGRNRAWLASIILRGLETSVYRKDRGWEDTIRLLESGDQTPVVMSYSACDGFPNPDIAGHTDDVDGDTWYDIEEHEQWTLALKALRKQCWFELKPSTFNLYEFYTGVNSFMIAEGRNTVNNAKEL